ncbi:MAG: HsdM family class I SAM-dependent methyltransferase [Minisyncoccia bacterium]
MFKITERSVYEPISEFLKGELGIESISEIRLENGFVDIFFQINSSSFVVEIKLGGEEKKLAKAVAQAWDYATQNNTRNVIALVFPKIKSGQTVFDIEEFKKQVLTQPVNGYVHTDFLEQWVENKELKYVFIELYNNFKNETRNVDFNSVVKAIRELVQDLYEVIRQANTNEIFEEVAKKLELFVGLGDIDKQKAKTQVSMLASYLLFNQLLFYHIYKIKTNNKKLEDLKPITSLNELKEYFNKIEDIDYKPIYAINLIDKIKQSEDSLSLINDVIKNLTLIRTEYITQDLAGRFFHALLPKEVAKVWAAFYTNPIAAEILARLAIDKWDEQVLDPACGSGTLLSACYKRKFELYKEQEKVKLNEDIVKNLHKKFLEEDITGIDIMPFAAHLTTINLALQKLEEPTNFVRIASMDSLDLELKASSQEFNNGKGIPIKPFSGIVQLTIQQEKMLIKRRGYPLSPSGLGKEFYLNPVDIVIMNPPFSDRDKLPKNYLKNLNKKEKLGKICGHQINLWGYFLALGDILLKQNGKIATVIPINIARGKATEKIRNYLLENYHIKYIVKTTKDLAFSESAAFRDILLVAEKRKPIENDITKIIFLKKSIKDLNERDLNSVNNLDPDFVSVRDIKYNELNKNKENLMPFLVPEDFTILLKELENSGKIILLDSKFIDIGLPYRPLGIADAVFITNNTDKSRIKNAFTILSKCENDKVIVKYKNSKQEFILDMNELAYALKTNTGINKISLESNELDFIFKKENNIYLNKLRLLNPSIPNPFPWNEHLKNNIVKEGFNLVIPRKIRLNSPNTFVISIISEASLNGLGPSLWYFKNKNYNIDDLKILNLYFNSIFTIVQIILYKSETLGAAYFELMKSDWSLFKILDVKKLSNKEKNDLLNLYDKLKDVKFPSIVDQLKNRFWARVELDTYMFKIVGIDNTKAEKLLEKSYNSILTELESITYK